MATVPKKSSSAKDKSSDSATATRVRSKRAATLAARPMSGFVEFLREQSVVGLAIGIIIGTQAKDVVNTLTSSFINPLAGLIIPGAGNLAQKQFTIHDGTKVEHFVWGSLVSSLINFIIIAAIVYFVFKALRLDRLDKKSS